MGRGSKRAAVILVVDDQEIVARVTQKMLIAAGYEVPAIVTDIDEFDRTVEATRPDLVLLDIELGSPTSGIDLAGRLPLHVPFVFLSAHADETTLALASARRPAGFVVKPFERAQLAAAVEMALAGRRPKEGKASFPDIPELAALSSREREVLEHLLDHKRGPAIARALHISQHTVRNHLKNIFDKLAVRSQQELLDFVTSAAAKRR